MLFESYMPSSSPIGTLLYAVPAKPDRLWFTAHLEASEMDICLSGNPSEYRFFSDRASGADLVLKRYHWVASFLRSENTAQLVNGYFSACEFRHDDVFFWDADALILGQDSPVPAAIYRHESGILLTAELKLREPIFCKPAVRISLDVCAK